MSEVLLPMMEGEWKKPPVELPGPFDFAQGPQPEAVARVEGSLITPLGLVEGEVLTALEQRGAIPMRWLIRELDWPASMVIMAVGALIRQGLVRATRHDLEVAIEPAPVPAGHLAVWGG